MTTPDLDHLDALFARATQGTWGTDGEYIWPVTDPPSPTYKWVISGDSEGMSWSPRNAEADVSIIVALHNAYPALAAQVRQATIIRAKSGNALADDLRALVEATCELGLLPWCDSAHWIRAANCIDEQDARIRELEARNAAMLKQADDLLDPTKPYFAGWNVSELDCLFIRLNLRRDIPDKIEHVNRLAITALHGRRLQREVCTQADKIRELEAEVAHLRKASGT